MHREEKTIEDILQIFHNSKGSIRNNLARWQDKSEDEKTSLKVEWQPYPRTPFLHAAGQFEEYTKKVPEQSKNDYT